MGAPQICGGLLLVIGIALLVVSQIIGGIITGAIDKALLNQKSTQFVCEGDDKAGSESDNYKNFIGENYFDPEGVPTYYDMYLFSINNPSDYLKGENATVVETGPFVFRTFSAKSSVVLNADGTTSYTTKTLYVLLDEDHTLSGKFEKKVKSMDVKKRMPSDISGATKISNFNLGYIGAMNLIGNEIAMLLTVAGCTSSQILAIKNIGAVDTNQYLNATGYPSTEPTMKDDGVTPILNRTNPAFILTAIQTCTDEERGTSAACACCAATDTMRGLNMGGWMKTGPMVCKGMKDTATAGLNATLLGAGFTGSQINGVIDNFSERFWNQTTDFDKMAYAAAYFNTAATGLTPAHANWNTYFPSVLTAVYDGVDDNLAAKNAAFCTTDTDDDVTTTPTCLSGGMIYGVDLTGMFCDKSIGWEEATLIMKKGYFATAYGKAATACASATTADTPVSTPATAAAKAAYCGAATSFLTSLGTATGIDHTHCSTLMSPTSPAVALISLLASYDGGTSVLNSGEDRFNATAFGQFAVTSPLVVTNSANDVMFGKPSAFMGALMPMLVINQIWTDYNNPLGPTGGLLPPGFPQNKTALKFAALNGQAGALGYPVPNQAEYTRRFQEACAGKCAVVTDIPGPMSPYKFMCSGNAPDRYDPFYIGKEGLLEFASNDCRPLSWTFSTAYFCGAFENRTKQCSCADPSIDATAADFGGCCLADGMAGGTDLTGFGCLTEGPGFVGTQVEDADMTASFQRKFAMLKAEDDANPNIQNTCPEDGDDVNVWVKFYGQTEHELTPTYISSVTGGDGTKFKPMGLTAAAGEEAISSPTAHHNETTLLFVGNALRPLTLNFEKNEMYGGKVNVARFAPKSNLLNSFTAAAEIGGPGESDAADKGVGIEFDGLANIKHFAPGKLTMFLSTPNFLIGDTENLIDQFEFYHCWEYEKYAAASSAFTDNALDLNKCELMTAAWVEENKEHLQVKIAVEPSLGLAIGGHSRLQANVQTLGVCNPAVDVACGLGLSFSQGECHKAAAAFKFADVGAQTQLFIGKYIEEVEHNTDWVEGDAGFPCSQANHFSPKLMGGKVMPLYWADIWAEATDDLLDALVTVGKVNASAKSMGTTFVGAGAALAVVGLLLVALCKGKADVAAA